MLSAEAAFEAYEAVRQRLPVARHLDRPRPSRTVADIAEFYDAVLLDAFGVLNVGESPIAGAGEAIAALRSANKHVLVVTNSASFPAAAALSKYRRLGFDFAMQEVVSSRDALVAGLRDEPPRRWGAMTHTGADLSDLGVNAGLLSDDPADYDAAEGFLLIGSSEWTAHRQELLAASLSRDPRPVLVGNPDIVAPRENGLSSEPGYYAHAAADALGLSPEFYGKPFRNIFDLAFQRLPAGIPHNRILMVGDSLHTDILGAAAVGIHSALVTQHGFFQGRDAAAAIAQSGIVPDHVIDHL